MPLKWMGGQVSWRGDNLYTPPPEPPRRNGWFMPVLFIVAGAVSVGLLIYVLWKL